jgi:hypothetical protein
MRVRMWVIQQALWIGLAISCVCPASSSQSESVTLDVAKGGNDAPLAGFDFGTLHEMDAGQSVAIGDPAATEGLAIGRVQSGHDDETPLTVIKSASMRDFELSMRFKSSGTKLRQVSGFIFRLVRPGNYYAVQADTRSQTIALVRVVQGQPEQLLQAEADVTLNQWHLFALRAEKDQLTVTFDGRWLFTVLDNTFSEAGRMALWTQGDGATLFDRIEVAPLPVSEGR